MFFQGPEKPLPSLRIKTCKNSFLKSVPPISGLSGRGIWVKDLTNMENLRFGRVAVAVHAGAVVGLPGRPDTAADGEPGRCQGDASPRTLGEADPDPSQFPPSRWVGVSQMNPSTKIKVHPGPRVAQFFGRLRGKLIFGHWSTICCIFPCGFPSKGGGDFYFDHSWGGGLGGGLRAWTKQGNGPLLRRGHHWGARRWRSQAGERTVGCLSGVTNLPTCPGPRRQKGVWISNPELYAPRPNVNQN